jgi:hypothetical protein
MATGSLQPGAERARLEADATRERNWKRWGPYLSERQWATVREDYSPYGSCWDYFPHDHARSRAYRWGEDGLLGFCDHRCRMAFALALWNGRDPILKERLFGLSNPEGNHGEDVKEHYFYLDSTPTHSYAKALYKYPQREYPYARLVEENRTRGFSERELELEDTGAFDGDRYFDVQAEYAKAGPNDVLIRITVSNRGPDAAALEVLPTLWFRNTWSWGRDGEESSERPWLRADGAGRIRAWHPELGQFRLCVDRAQAPGGRARRGETEPSAAREANLPSDVELLFTENETNAQRLFGGPNRSPYVKDAFHAYVIEGRRDAVNPAQTGTKAAARFRLELAPGASAVLRLRLSSDGEAPVRAFGRDFDATFAARIAEADEFYASLLPAELGVEERRVARQGYAGLLWSKQFYHYVVKDWIEGDPAQPAPPAERARGRNAEWAHLYNRDVISMPDKWEYPWYAAWDLAFHMIPFARVDPHFAKHQLELMLREWYMHPNGQIPAYEFALHDVNAPVHAWAAFRVYKISAPRGKRDRAFLRRVFKKLLLNFTWWVNRKDPHGRNLFAGGFLGLDNIGVFDRSQPLPTGGHLEQADGTAWMAFYSATMLAMALELAREDPVYEDMASKFFEHFVSIVDAINTLGGTGLWDERDGFYYDQLHANGKEMPLRVRSLVGLLPLIAAEVIEDEAIEGLRGFRKRLDWFLKYRAELARHISFFDGGGHGHRLLAVPSRERLEKLLRYMLDEREFLAPHGIRSVSRVHAERPFSIWVDGHEHRVDYVPGEGTSGAFGGNSNWRGPIWFPINYLIVEALEKYDHFYGDAFQVECPVGSGRRLRLGEVARELGRRLASIFLPDAAGRRPFAGEDRRWAESRWYRELVLFHEYFHGDTGRGLGASHQTGWTALVVRLLEDQV